YTLVELVPEAAQQDLLLQAIDVSMPATLPATVGEALRYVLLRSGYTLCEADPDTAALHHLPLPAAHLRLGPLFLRDALLTLACALTSVSTMPRQLRSSKLRRGSSALTDPVRFASLLRTVAMSWRRCLVPPHGNPLHP